MTSYPFMHITFPLLRLTFPSGASLQIEGDKVIGRVDPEPTALPCPAGFSAFRSPDMGSFLCDFQVSPAHGSASLLKH